MYHRIGQGGKRYWGSSGAGILFTDGEKILLLRRNDKSADTRGTWGIPGGKTDGNETPIETAKRESREEAGCVQGVRFAQFDERDGHHTFTVFLFRVDKPFPIRLSEEHDKAEWIDLNDVHNYSLHPEFSKHFPYYLKAIHRKFPKNFAEWLYTK